MTAYNSDQIANQVAVPPVLNETNVVGGRVRIYGWTYTVPAGDLTALDTINLVDLPAGARILGGRMSWGAMGTSCTALIGITGDTDRYKGSTDVSSAGEADIANTNALNFMEKRGPATRVFCTTGGGNWDAGAHFKGYLLVALD